MRILQEAGEEFLSGEALGKRLGISRMGVCKRIRHLEAEGYAIERRKGRGYRLLEVSAGALAVSGAGNKPPGGAGESGQAYGQAAIEAELQTEWAGRHLRFYASTDSTNARARAEGDKGAPHGWLAVADAQEAGQGRRGRSWHSPGGKHLYFSLLLRPELDPGQASMLTLVMALSVCKALEVCVPEGDFAIKWPNDILLSGRKLCGILTEMRSNLDGIEYVIVGVGLNVGEVDASQPWAEHAIGLAGWQESLRTDGALRKAGTLPGRSRLLAAILESWEREYALFCSGGDMAAQREAYETRLANKHRQVRIEAGPESWQGLALGISNAGELLVEREDGRVEAVYAGEVSVRGLYGYV